MMKRILSLALVLLMLLSALVLSGCDETEPPIPAPDAESQSEETKDESKTISNNKTNTGNQKPSTPVPLAKLNGKTPQQMVNDTMQQLLNAEEFELDQETVITASGNGVTTSVEVELLSRKGADSAYAKQIAGGETGEAWYVDGIYYFKTSAGQVKYEDVSFAQFCEDRIATFDEDDAGIGAGIQFAGIQFQPEGEDYSLTLPVSEEMGLELCAEIGYEDADDVVFTLVLLFDKNGTLLLHTYDLSFTTVSQGITVQVDMLMNTEIVSLNKPITVSKPAQASSFVLTAYPTEEEV